ncbi:uncharacterized protein P174DRAFT_516530 [Aspergillus novofumigatus IBT 16806]|uniref:APS kinase domain-containing protein n=1 Tax=Aspergillus novofumigatus (strain IBT 16806) TaxID=1392255 RepID=A0A2I1BST8_ASPN1|nr:uncharacterized protein P174DRAFT_516530 [Aspergillus novofumigatus IBT 16806]PKX88458.1 hypothetical protein P174DRAFT_516530 [Aspergillus novofumigatus IBT 16806]
MIVQVILLSGRSGVGKTTIASEMSEHLKIHGIPHAHIDGDNLDMVYPEEEGPDLLLLNLESMFGNYYRRRGCSRLILSGTAMALEYESIQNTLQAVIQDSLQFPREREPAIDLRGFILTATDNTASERLRKREIGSLLDHHLASGLRMASVLENEVGGWACRISTDGRTVKDIAAQILEQANWV